MQALRKVAISGTGMYVPPKVVTNHDLAKLMDTSDEWIHQRTGIRERHYAEEGGPAHLGLEASKKALETAGLKAEDLDLIIAPTLASHHEFPGNAAFLQDLLGLSEIPAMDIRCQCTGFIYALQVGHLYVAAGQYDRVLICGAELHSTGLDYSTRGRDVTVIFGDGAGAIILEPSDDGERGILSVHTHTQGKHAKKLWLEAPACSFHPRTQEWMFGDARMFPQMDGRFVFKHAVVRLPQVIQEALDANKCKLEDVDLFVFHQANLRINEYVAGQLGIPPEKTYSNIDRYGNCSAASIPMCLDECARSGRLKRGDLVCLAGFGSGFTWGSALLRW